MLSCYATNTLLLLCCHHIVQRSFAFQTIQRSDFKSKSLRAVPDEAEATEGDIGIGIDLGTTNSAVAFLVDGIPTIIPIPNNGRTVPSVVSLLKDGTAVVGNEATEPVYRNVKRVLGTGGKIGADTASAVPFLKPNSSGKTYKKFSLQNQIDDAEGFPTLLRALDNDSEDSPCIRPEEVSSAVLSYLKSVAEQHTGKKVTRAVVGVPAHFHDGQRDATKRAAEMAGISKVKLLREPEAAALAYGVGKEQIGLGDEDELVLVFDLGGGTYDVSMLAVGGGVTEIISTSGNPQLGGSVFDVRIAEHLRKLTANKFRWSPESKTMVNLVAEAVRIYLSNNRVANLALPVEEDAWLNMKDPSDAILPMGTSLEGTNKIHTLVQLTRKDMELVCKEEFQALLRPIREVAIMANALLPGDTSPTAVEAALDLEAEEKAFRAEESVNFGDFYGEDGGSEKQKTEDLLQEQQILEIDMKEAKKAQQRGRKRARNVAKQERKYREEKRKIDVRVEDDKIKVRDGINGRPISRVVLVGGATRMPGIGRLLAAVTGVVPQKTVNPDEAVALGCAVQVGVLDGGVGTVLNPMQSAILRAVAIQQGFGDDDFDAGFDEGFEDEEAY